MECFAFVPQIIEIIAIVFSTRLVYSLLDKLESTLQNINI